MDKCGIRVTLCPAYCNSVVLSQCPQHTQLLLQIKFSALAEALSIKRCESIRYGLFLEPG